MALGVPKTHDMTRARTHGLHDMCGVHPVATMTQGLVRLTSPRAGTRAPKLCAVSQLRKPWVQCHVHQDGLAMSAMPYAPRGINHGRNVMTRCYGVGPDNGNKQHAQAMGT